MANILLVDDSKAVTYIVRKFLETEGHTVTTAHSGQAALSQLESQSFDILILDVMMPGMDGFELAEKIKSNPATAKIPFLYFTAKGDLSDQFHGYLTGAEHYLTKPVRKKDLLDKIELALGVKKAPVPPEFVKRGSLAQPPAEDPQRKLEGRRKKSNEETRVIEKATVAPQQALCPDPMLEMINIYGSMIEVMWAFSFDKLLSFDDLSVIEEAIERVCTDHPFMQYIAFSEDGIELDNFKVRVSDRSPEEISLAFALLIQNFFEIILERQRKKTSRKVCLVTYDKAHGENLRRLLKAFGYQVECIQGSANALLDAASLDPDLVLLSCDVFAEGEEALVKASKRDSVLGKAPLVVVGEKNRASHSRALAAGVDEYISVGGSNNALVRMLRAIVK